MPKFLNEDDKDNANASPIAICHCFLKTTHKLKVHAKTF